MITNGKGRKVFHFAHKYMFETDHMLLVGIISFVNVPPLLQIETQISTLTKNKKRNS